MDFYGVNVKDNVTAEGTPDLGTSGNPFGTLYGESTSAKYADLAEKYTTKGYCPIGTVMAVCADRDADTEACNQDLDPCVVGVISEKPALKMNEDSGGEYIGLVGQVPVRVVGIIHKKDFLVPTKDGCARAGLPHEIPFKLGVALETNLNAKEKLVMCFIK